MTTVYLHIGLPKTGTTAIQNFLTANDAVLKSHGICFPDLGLRYSGIGWRRNAHFLIRAYKNKNGKKDRTRPCTEYDATLDKIALLGSSYEKIILTDEAIWRASQSRPNFWTRIREDFSKRNMELRIIVYLRRQDEFVQSLYRQKVKSSSTCLPFADYLRELQKINYPLDFLSYLNTLSDVFGKDNLIVRIYGNNQYRGKEHTLISDFLDIFGLSLEDDFKNSKSVYNPSLNGTYLELRRILNALPVSPIKNGILRKSIGEILRSNPYTTEPDKNTLFQEGKQAEFLDQFALSNRQAAQKYHAANPDENTPDSQTATAKNCQDSDGLFFAQIEDLPVHEVPTEDLLRDVILIYGNAIQQLEQQNKRLEAKIRELQNDALWFRLKRKLRHLFKK